MFSSISVVGLILAGVATVHGFYEVTVTEEERAQKPSRNAVENQMDCVAPLIQTYGPNHVYMATTSVQDTVVQVLGKGFTYAGILGSVVSKKEGCECGDGTELIPATMMTKVGGSDWYLATNADDIAKMKASGYTERRVDFYCSPEQNKCGATQPLYRNKMCKSYPSGRFTTILKEHEVWDQGGCAKDGIICYIWGSQYSNYNYWIPK